MGEILCVATDQGEQKFLLALCLTNGRQVENYGGAPVKCRLIDFRPADVIQHPRLEAELGSCDSVTD